MKLGHNSMEEHVQKILKWFHYMDYIQEERVKIQSFLSSLPIGYRDQIKFVDLQTLEKTLRTWKDAIDLRILECRVKIGGRFSMHGVILLPCAMTATTCRG